MTSSKLSFARRRSETLFWFFLQWEGGTPLLPSVFSLCILCRSCKRMWPAVSLSGCSGTQRIVL